MIRSEKHRILNKIAVWGVYCYGELGILLNPHERFHSPRHVKIEEEEEDKEKEEKAGRQKGKKAGRQEGKRGRGKEDKMFQQDKQRTFIPVLALEHVF